MNRIVVLVLVSLCSAFAAKSVNIEKEMALLAGKVTASIGEDVQGKSVLLLPINDSRAPGFGPLIEQFLTEPLVNQGKISLVDRSNLATIIAESELSALVGNPIQAGKLSSANFMISGTIATGFDKTYLVTVRLISTETSKVIGVASLEIPQAELDKRVQRN